MTAARERKYLEAEINTASPLRLVLMVYDVALAGIRRAEALDFRTERVEFIDSVSKAQEALLTLLEGLDASKSPQLASNLSALYLYMYRRLLEARTEGAKEALSEVRKHLEELREAWRELLERGLGEGSRAASGEEGRVVSVVG